MNMFYDEFFMFCMLFTGHRYWFMHRDKINVFLFLHLARYLANKLSELTFFKIVRRKINQLFPLYFNIKTIVPHIKLVSNYSKSTCNTSMYKGGMMQVVYTYIEDPTTIFIPLF